MPTSRRRSVHRTQWAAQFAVASELCKLGHEVAFTMGNHPSIDIMVRSQGGAQFGIDVKGLYARNHWVVKPKPPMPGLYYILAYVPDGTDNRFFIFNQAEMNAEIAADDGRVRARAAAKGKIVERDPFQGVPWAIAENYEGAWGKLPQ